jgi:hypothetical protein
MAAYCTSPAVLQLQLLDSSGNLVNSLDLMDAAGSFRVEQFDLGFPTVRAVTAALPTRDGDYDSTALVGPRTVTIAGSAVPSTAGSRQAALGLLAYWAQPRLRPRLVYVVDADQPARYLGLRGAALAAPMSNPTVSAFTVSWVTPDPVAYSTATHTATISPPATAAGRAYNLTFNRHYPTSFGGSGVGYAVNNGQYQTWPILRIDGPCTNPQVLWVTPPGGAVVFTGLTLTAGHYLLVDTHAQTVYEDGDPTANRYSYLDFVNTRWAPLPPGQTTLRFNPATFSTPCLLTVTWPDAWL